MTRKQMLEDMRIARFSPRWAASEQRQNAAEGNFRRRIEAAKAKAKANTRKGSNQ